MNITLLNMAYAMLFFKNVKLMFWGDEVQCVMYLRNIYFTDVLDSKSPYEMWFGCIPLVRHLKIFRSTCYASIHKEQRRKLGSKSCKYIFLGYSSCTKGYKLYDKINKKFLFVRDTIFS